MEKIKIEEILKKHNLIHVSKVLQMKAGDSGYDDRTLKSIKEIVELAIDKCDVHCIACTGLSDDSSLQEIKQMIDYE